MDTQPKASASAQEFVSAFGGRLVGDPGQRVHQFASLTRAGPGEASFFSNLRLIYVLVSFFELAFRAFLHFA